MSLLRWSGRSLSWVLGKGRPRSCCGRGRVPREAGEALPVPAAVVTVPGGRGCRTGTSVRRRCRPPRCAGLCLGSSNRGFRQIQGHQKDKGQVRARTEWAQLGASEVLRAWPSRLKCLPQAGRGALGQNFPRHGPREASRSGTSVSDSPRAPRQGWQLSGRLNSTLRLSVLSRLPSWPVSRSVAHFLQLVWHTSAVGTCPQCVRCGVVGKSWALSTCRAVAAAKVPRGGARALLRSVASLVHCLRSDWGPRSLC